MVGRESLLSGDCAAALTLAANAHGSGLKPRGLTWQFESLFQSSLERAVTASGSGVRDHACASRSGQSNRGC